MSNAYKVGQSLWWTSFNNARTQGKVTITKVGRTWLTLSNGHRIYPDTLTADGKGYSAPGRCWLSEETYRTHTERNSAWSKLVMKMRDQNSRIPSGVTTEDIQRASDLLGLSKEGGAA